MYTDVFPLSEILFAIVANETIGTALATVSVPKVTAKAKQLFPDREWNKRTVSSGLQRNMARGWLMRSTRGGYRVSPEHIATFWNDRTAWMAYLSPEVLQHVKKM